MSHKRKLYLLKWFILYSKLVMYPVYTVEIIDNVLIKIMKDIFLF